MIGEEALGLIEGDDHENAIRESAKRDSGAPMSGPAARRCQVTFYPIVGTKDEYGAFFADKGFPDAAEITLVAGTSGFVSVAGRFRADAFVRTFHQAIFKGRAMYVSKVEPKVTAPRTVHVANLRASTTDRQLYEVFREWGFIRRIQRRADFPYAFIEFDSPEDASNVMQHCGSQFTTAGQTWLVSLAKSERAGAERARMLNIALPLDSLVSQEHPCWGRLTSS